MYSELVEEQETRDKEGKYCAFCKAKLVCAFSAKFGEIHNRFHHRVSERRLI